MSRTALACRPALAALLCALAAAAAAPDAEIDPSDLEVGQVGRIDTRGGKLTFFSAPENPIGDGEVIVVPRNEDGGNGRPFILRRVDVKKFPPGKAVRLDGSFKVVTTRNYRDRFHYVLEPVK